MNGHFNGTARSIGDRGEIIALPRQPVFGVGHNSRMQIEPSFQTDADTIVRVGSIVTSWKRLGVAIRDPRCKRPHLRVAFNLMDKLNGATGTAFPSRRAVAQEEELSEKTVENVLYDLRNWGYIDWERRAVPELHKGRLLHYTVPVTRWSEADITNAILKWREENESQKSTRQDGDIKVPAGAGTKGTRSNGDFVEKYPPGRGEKYPPGRGQELVEGTGRIGERVRPTTKQEPSVLRSPLATKADSGPLRATTQVEMAAALNPEVAYAERNITISPSGRLTIGQEFRNELREVFTDEQIEGALDCTLAAMGANRNKVQIIAQVRRQCTFKRENEKKLSLGKAKSGSRAL